MLLDQIERFARLELALKHERRAVSQGGRQRVDGPVRPEERNPDEDAILRRQALTFADVEPVLDYPVLHHPHGLRPTTRARRVEDDAVVGGACARPWSR